MIYGITSNFLGMSLSLLTIASQEGGVASGFTHAEINDYSEIKRLLWVRGRQQVRADEMPFEWASLNKSDCFIIDMGNVSLMILDYIEMYIPLELRYIMFKYRCHIKGFIHKYSHYPTNKLKRCVKMVTQGT